MKLTPKNALEAAVLKMVEEGKPLHGYAREVLIEMSLREAEENTAE